MGCTLYQFAFFSVLTISTTFVTQVSPKNPGPALVMVVETKEYHFFWDGLWACSDGISEGICVSLWHPR